MPLTIPTGVDAEGMLKIIWTPTKTLSIAVLSGATSVELSCYLIKDTFGQSADTETGTDERVCSKEVYETQGKTKWTIDNLVYVWTPQAAALDANNKAYEILKQNTPGTLTVRWGKDVDVALTVGDKVDQFPINLGAQVRQKPEANGKLRIEQRVFVTGQAALDQVLIA